MSADTSRSIPITSLNNAQNNSPTAPVIGSNQVVIEPPAFPTASVRKDLSSIPPVFFAGSQKREKSVLFEPQFSSDSSSVAGYGDRRLSGILAQTTEEEEEIKEKKDEKLEIPKKRIMLDEIDANRGVFGDKRKVKNIPNGSMHVDTLLNKTEEYTSKSSINQLQPSKTIRVFGYPLNLIHNVIQHFSNYGKIESYSETSGNWLNITYESSTHALAALKANGIIISNSHMIGVSLEKEEPSTIQKIIPLEDSQDVFKNLNGLGSGNIGKSAIDTKNKQPTSGGTTTNGGFISIIKDVLLGW